MRADSATVASVWSRNTTTKISPSDASNAAIGARTPSSARRRAMIRATARAPTSSGASAISPCGATVAANVATTIATAAGHNRRVAIAFSTSIQVSSVPNAMIGSGRSPLLNGSHAARNTAPAVHTATRLAASARPSRGSTQRDRISQHPMPASVAGSRIHTPAVLTEASCPSRLWYQSNGASVVPK